MNPKLTPWREIPNKGIRTPVPMYKTQQQPTFVSFPWKKSLNLRISYIKELDDNKVTKKHSGMSLNTYLSVFDLESMQKIAYGVGERKLVDF